MFGYLVMRQLKTQDPFRWRGGQRASAQAPSFAGLKNGEFEVVGIYLSDSAIQNQILNLSWSDFRVAMGAQILNLIPSRIRLGGPGSMVMEQISGEMLRTANDGNSRTP